MKLRSWLTLAVAAGLLLSAAPAQAGTTFKNGAEINTAQANCFPLRAFPAYTQQTATGSSTGIEPKVEDVFYLSITVSFFQTFDCAADFFSTQVTLPPNVQPAVGGSAIPICRRYGGTSPNFFFDPRAPNVCPTSISFNGSTRQFSIFPRDGAAVPDFPLPAGQFFIGQRAPQESALYHSVQLLVPVRASATMTDQPIGFLVCSVGTSCASGSVPLTVTPAPAMADPPQVSIPGNAFTSATGARVPFTINVSNNNGYWLKVDTATDSNFASGRPCGAGGPFFFAAAGGSPFTGDFSSEVQFGDLQTGGTICNLEPNTTYFFKACSAMPNTGTELACRVTSFKTGNVTTSFEPPEQSAADLPGNTQAVLSGHQVVGGHPAGSLFARRRLKDAGGAFTTATGNQSIGASTSSSGAVTQTASGLTPWRTHEIQSCFQVTAGSLFCGDPVEVVAGFATAPSDATGVGETSATLSGNASAPSPDGTMRFLIGTTNPGGDDVRTVLSEGASTPVAARGGAGDPVTGVVNGLTPGTTYFWAACFDNPAGSGIEDCSPPRSFTTAGTAPQPGGGGTPDPGTPPPGGTTPGGTAPGGGGPVGGTADTLKPKASVKLKGKVKRGKKVTLTVTATDASGIKSVTIKVGKARAKATRSVTIRLPRRKATIKVLITVTDRAGNVAKVTKTLKVK